MSKLLDAVRKAAKTAAPPWLSGRTLEQRQADNILRDTFASPGRPVAIVEALINEHLALCEETGQIGHADDVKHERWREYCSRCALLRSLAEAMGVATGGTDGAES
jgi:hypothetical protein